MARNMYTIHSVTPQHNITLRNFGMFFVSQVCFVPNYNRPTAIQKDTEEKKVKYRCAAVEQRLVSLLITVVTVTNTGADWMKVV